MLEHQRQKTYQHEYERVKGNINRLKIQGLPTHNHKKRLTHLKKVAQASLAGTNTHELYKKYLITSFTNKKYFYIYNQNGCCWIKEKRYI